MKKQFQKSVLAVSMLGLMAGVSGSAVAASEEGSSTAHVVEALTLTPNGVLAFGTFAAGATAQNVTIVPSTCDVSTSLPHFDGHGCGRFIVNGANGRNYVVTYEGSTTLSDGNGNSMTAAITLDGLPVKTVPENLQFGGALNVGADQPAGAYEGTYSVTANYQS